MINNEEIEDYITRELEGKILDFVELDFDPS
jgi:hypothetical protein